MKRTQIKQQVFLLYISIVKKYIFYEQFEHSMNYLFSLIALYFLILSRHATSLVPLYFLILSRHATSDLI